MQPLPILLHNYFLPRFARISLYLQVANSKIIAVIAVVDAMTLDAVHTVALSEFARTGNRGKS